MNISFLLSLGLNVNSPSCPLRYHSLWPNWPWIEQKDSHSFVRLDFSDLCRTEDSRRQWWLVELSWYFDLNNHPYSIYVNQEFLFLDQPPHSICMICLTAILPCCIVLQTSCRSKPRTNQPNNLQQFLPPHLGTSPPTVHHSASTSSP